LVNFQPILNCSIVFILAGGRIIGGDIARSGQFPFAAAIYTTTVDGNFFCGGTLVTDQWILTAGQCVDGYTLYKHFDMLLISNEL
jgi:secreted trypsin-like serine protease